MHWEYFYDPYGHPLVWLYRTLGTLRRTCPALRSAGVFYYGAESRPADGVVAYRRSTPNSVTLVFLNFADAPQALTIPTPAVGTFREMVDQRFHPGRPFELQPAAVGDPLTVTVPSNHGYVFVNGS